MSTMSPMPVMFGQIETVARGLIALVLAVLLLGSLTGGASAETSVTREETQSARLTTGAASLEVITPDKTGGVSACLSFGDGTETGCADVGASFVLASNLSSASLAPTVVDLFRYVCEGKTCDEIYTRAVTVEATWTGVSTGQRVHEHLSGGGDPCTVDVISTGVFQPATGTLVVDGETSEGTGDLQALADVTRRTCQ